MPPMADWRQIQARIRKAKNSPDAHAKLSELYQRTRDAMVAWELALIQEKAELKEDAVKWYTIAAERFRRAEWKKKAGEALTRLGAALPSGSAIPTDPVSAEEPRFNSFPEPSSEEPANSNLAPGEISESADDANTPETSTAEVSNTSAPEAGEAEKKKRRRGRRGGRGRRRKGAPVASGLPSQAFAESTAPQSLPPTQSRPPAPQRHQSPRAPSQQTKSFERAPTHSAPPAIAVETFEPSRSEQAAPQLPSERIAHGRAGDPALASRMSHLESMLRRLVASPLHRLDTEEAPAGPGVFLLSDSDQITSYYVEACQTLRVGVGNLARGLRSAKNVRGVRSYSDSGLKAKLAEHLGISESKVSQYMKDHCVLRL